MQQENSLTIDIPPSKRNPTNTIDDLIHLGGEIHFSYDEECYFIRQDLEALQFMYFNAVNEKMRQRAMSKYNILRHKALTWEKATPNGVLMPLITEKEGKTIYRKLVPSIYG